MKQLQRMADRKPALILTSLVLFFVILTITQDMLRADLKDTAFYFSESFLFSSFWWIFGPLFYLQYRLTKYPLLNPALYYTALVILPILLHLFLFPFLVWLLSALFYYHTFSFEQTLRYSLANHFYLLLLFYAMGVPLIRFFTRPEKITEPVPAADVLTDLNPSLYINSLLITARNTSHPIPVSDILYISADPPYISIHLPGKKHLHKETLKAISVKLNSEQFVRIHKSTIINIKMVVACTTRLNGDYDIMLINKEQLRVSRNFAAEFKKRFGETHQVSVK